MCSYRSLSSVYDLWLHVCLSKYSSWSSSLPRWVRVTLYPTFCSVPLRPLNVDCIEFLPVNRSDNHMWFWHVYRVISSCHIVLASNLFLSIYKNRFDAKTIWKLEITLYPEMVPKCSKVHSILRNSKKFCVRQARQTGFIDDSKTTFINVTQN